MKKNKKWIIYIYIYIYIYLRKNNLKVEVKTCLKLSVWKQEIIAHHLTCYLSCEYNLFIYFCICNFKKN